MIASTRVAAESRKPHGFQFLNAMLDDADMMSCHSGPQPMLVRVKGLPSLMVHQTKLLCRLVFLALALSLRLPFWGYTGWIFTAAAAALRLLHLPKYLGMCVHMSRYRACIPNR